MTSTGIVELSHKLNPAVQTYPGDTPFSCHPLGTSEKDGYNTRFVTIGSHCGTHIDAPFHFFADGKTIDQIPLFDLIAPAVIVDLSHKNLKARQKITWADLAAYADRFRVGKIVLMNTGWSKYWGTEAYYSHPFFARDVAENLFKLGITVVGIDTLNPDETPYEGVGGEDGFEFHNVILGGGGVIAENLTNLSSLVEGDDWVISLIPLNLEGSDGSPIRAFARRKS